MGTLAEYIPPLMLWAAIAFSVPSLPGRARDPGARSFLATLLALACGATLLLPGVYAWVERALGVPHIARPLANGSIVLGGWSVQRFLAHLDPAARARASVRFGGWVAVGAVVALAVLFSLANLEAARVEDFRTRYGREPRMVLYRLVFLSYLGFAMYSVARQSWSLSRMGRSERPERPDLWLGAGMVAAGALVTVGYVAHESVYLVARWFGVHELLAATAMTARSLMAAATVLVVAGSTTPAWGRAARIPELWGRFHGYRSYRTLRALHREVCRVMPEAERHGRAGTGPRWYACLIEIEDACLELRSYVDRRVTDQVRSAARGAGLPDEQVRIEVAAAGLRAAIRAKAGGVRPEEVDPRAILPDDSTGSERRYYEQVAEVYARSGV